MTSMYPYFQVLLSKSKHSIWHRVVLELLVSELYPSHKALIMGLEGITYTGYNLILALF